MIITLEKYQMSKFVESENKAIKKEESTRKKATFSF